MPDMRRDYYDTPFIRRAFYVGHYPETAFCYKKCFASEVGMDTVNLYIRFCGVNKPWTFSDPYDLQLCSEHRYIKRRFIDLIFHSFILTHLFEKVNKNSKIKTSIPNIVCVLN